MPMVRAQHFGQFIESFGRKADLGSLLIGKLQIAGIDLLKECEQLIGHAALPEGTGGDIETRHGIIAMEESTHLLQYWQAHRGVSATASRRQHRLPDKARHTAN